MALKIDVGPSKWVHMDGTIETLDELKKVADVLGREVTTDTFCTEGVPGDLGAVYTEAPCVWAYFDWHGQGPGFVGAAALTIGSSIRFSVYTESKAGRIMGSGLESGSSVETPSGSD